MKKQLLTALLLLAGAGVKAQTNDSVLLTTGYANQVWYSLENDEQATAPKNNWDLAFDMKAITSSIHINTVAGINLWAYPKSNASGWASVDTNGLGTWVKRYNSDTSWSLGAMGNYANPSDPTDLDWGKYDVSTHIVTGDSIYILKLQNGDYKKLIIESLSSGTFTFKYANLDGSGLQKATIVKSNFPGKNFAYYSLQNNMALPATREPDADKWDLIFTQYTAFIPQAYTVTGVLHNRGVRVAEVNNLSDKNTYKNYGAHTMESAINIIGYDWKSYTGSGYKLKDSTAYFVKAVDGSIWKMIFTGFASTDGKSVFSKEKLLSVGISGINVPVASMAIYPNPAPASHVNIVYNVEQSLESVVMTVQNIHGAIIYTVQLDGSIGLHQYDFNQPLATGTYVVAIRTKEGNMVQKLVVQ